MGEVIKLPTAARRKVQQPCNRQGRVARAAFRSANPWPGEFLFAGQREAISRAKVIRGAGGSPEMAVLTAILRALPQDIRDNVAAQFAAGATHAPKTIVRQAYEIIRLERMTIGEMVDWEFANDYLNKKGL
jgi:hypothetical protein